MNARRVRHGHESRHTHQSPAVQSTSCLLRFNRRPPRSLVQPWFLSRWPRNASIPCQWFLTSRRSQQSRNVVCHRDAYAHSLTSDGDVASDRFQLWPAFSCRIPSLHGGQASVSSRAQQPPHARSLEVQGTIDATHNGLGVRVTNRLDSGMGNLTSLKRIRDDRHRQF